MKLQITGIHGWDGDTPEKEAIQYLQEIMELLYPVSQEDGEGFAHLILGSACGPGTGLNNIPSRAATYFFSDIACEEMSPEDVGHFPDDVVYAVAEDTPFYQLEARFV